uniref:Uncharacterized protein n=1 Tax=Aegilops tauschii subsp. strangulata TaxID=200361 RepID=A0A452ZNW3_AEGTS
MTPQTSHDESRRTAMASSSSPAAPLLVPWREDQDRDDAAARSDGGSPREQGVMQSWAEAMLLCCGDAERLWRRVVLRKWLNVGAGSGDSDFSADEAEAEAEADDEEPGHQGPPISISSSVIPSPISCERAALLRSAGSEIGGFLVWGLECRQPHCEFATQIASRWMIG